MSMHVLFASIATIGGAVQKIDEENLALASMNNISKVHNMKSLDWLRSKTGKL